MCVHLVHIHVCIYVHVGKPTPTLTNTANSCLKGKRSAQVICYGEVIPTSKRARTINKNKPADKNPKWSRNSTKKKITSTDRECCKSKQCLIYAICICQGCMFHLAKSCKRGTTCKRWAIAYECVLKFHRYLHICI